VIPPRLPFPGYKWRWATLTPTEGLNEPPIYLGVLRVLKDNQGARPRSEAVADGLARVRREVEGRVATRLRVLREDEGRNILRNSQQYWKALGLLQGTRGGIQLTPFGLAVADGRVTRDEFAATVVATLELPNRAILTTEQIEVWDHAGLRIHPLRLILDIMLRLGSLLGSEQAYLTPDELIRVIIPLAGDLETTMAEYVGCVQRYRDNALDMGGWPNCVPDDNDPRMAREFLLYLSHYGFCEMVEGQNNLSDRFAVQMDSATELRAIVNVQVPEETEALVVADLLRTSGIEPSIERRRVMRAVLERPQQAQFRRAVMRAYRSECLITRERIPEILEAAHIIPVEYRGPDTAGNGICLRSDIHSLFDSGHLRIAPDGRISFSDALSASPNYRELPPQIQFPNFVRQESLEWRWQYQ